MLSDLKILFFGCGKMGSAVLDGVLKNGVLPKNVRVVDTSDDILSACLTKRVHGGKKASFFQHFNPDIVFIAVKPFCVDAILDDIKPFTDKGALFVSIVAGKRLSGFEKKLGSDVAFVRAMPNTPACIGKGITGAVCNDKTSPEQKEKASLLLKTCGDLFWLDDENLLDAVTAVSGSGPAYVFYFIEQLASSAEKAGLPKDLCMTLARQTVYGSACLMQETNEDPAVLRQNVTTPNGTTAAALSVLEKQLPSIMTEAVTAAKQRSKELAS